MIDTQNFNFEKRIAYYVVGTPVAINDLRTYVDLHTGNGIVYLSNFMKRIVFHDAYCFVMPQSLPYYPVAAKFKRELKKTCRWITLDGYVAAFYLAYPEKAMKSLPFSPDDVLNYAIKENEWISLFNVDIDDVISRIHKCSDSNA